MDDFTAWLTEQLDWDERDLSYAYPSLPPASSRWWHQGSTMLMTERRARAELAAKRRRLERHQPDTHFLHGVICRWCSTPQVGAYQSWPCPDVRDDVAIYADRPGYRPEWGPDRA
ncbi:DUF6221 family protein [Micromonospora sediminicola]|uniref:DUF6221 family protein n=1 Tax=Micromonospora sediminicola TaxID=946078 RepID=UPI0037B096ED